METFNAAAQRARLAELAEALGSADSAVRHRDECGDPRIEGKQGHAYAVPGDFLLYVCCETKQQWTWAKKALAFTRVSQEGDEEGCLILDRLPTPAEAEAIRAYLGVHKRPELSPETVEKRRSFGHRLAKNRHSATADYVDSQIAT